MHWKHASFKWFENYTLIHVISQSFSLRCEKSTKAYSHAISKHHHPMRSEDIIMPNGATICTLLLPQRDHYGCYKTSLIRCVQIQHTMTPTHHRRQLLSLPSELMLLMQMMMRCARLIERKIADSASSSDIFSQLSLRRENLVNLVSSRVTRTQHKTKIVRRMGWKM